MGPRPDIDWNQPWHTILHSWHNRFDQQLEYHGFKILSAKYLLGEAQLTLERRRWKAWTVIFPMANSNTKIFAAGIGWAPGLILRKAPISGSSTTRTLFPLFSYDNDAIFISSCIVSRYCHLVFAFHFLCPKWAAARQTGSKSKTKSTSYVRYYISHSLHHTSHITPSLLT